MCLNEKITYIIKVKSRNSELYLLKKNDFLKLTLNFKDVFDKFLQKSLFLYLKFNEEMMKVIKDYEEKYININQINPTNEVNFLNTQVEIDKSLDKISENEIEDKSDKEYNLIDRNETFLDDEKKILDKIYLENGLNLENYQKNNEIENMSGLLSKTDQFVEKFKNISTSENPTSKDVSPRFKSLTSNKNLNFVLNKLPDDFNSFYLDHNQNDANENVLKSKEIVHLENENYISEFNNQSNNYLNINSSILPINELNSYIVKLNEEMHMKFCKTVEKIEKFLEMNNISFKGIEDEKNPILLLKKLKIIKDINERNKFINDIDSIIKYIKNVE